MCQADRNHASTAGADREAYHGCRISVDGASDERCRSSASFKVVSKWTDDGARESLRPKVPVVRLWTDYQVTSDCREERTSWKASLGVSVPESAQVMALDGTDLQ